MPLSQLHWARGPPTFFAHIERSSSHCQCKKPLNNMSSAAQGFGRYPEQIDAGDTVRSLGLPRVGNQRSLRDLIEDDLHSRDDESIEMTNLLLRRDDNADSDGTTTAAPSLRAPDAGDEVEHGTLQVFTPADDDSNSRSTDVTNSKSINTSANKSFWRRLITRYECPV